MENCCFAELDGVLGMGIKGMKRMKSWCGIEPSIVKLAIFFSEETLINETSSLNHPIFWGKADAYRSKSRLMIM